MKKILALLIVLGTSTAFANDQGLCKVTLKVRDTSPLTEFMQVNDYEYFIARNDVIAGTADNAEECLCAADESAIRRYVGGWKIKNIHVEFSRDEFKTSSFYKNTDSLRASLNTLRKRGFCTTSPKLYKIER